MKPPRRFCLTDGAVTSCRIAPPRDTLNLAVGRRDQCSTASEVTPAALSAYRPVDTRRFNSSNQLTTLMRGDSLRRLDEILNHEEVTVRSDVTAAQALRPGTSPELFEEHAWRVRPCNSFVLRFLGVA
jgi:hypothetical protein